MSLSCGVRRASGYEDTALFLLMGSLFAESRELFSVPYGILPVGSGNLAKIRQGYALPFLYAPDHDEDQ